MKFGRIYISLFLVLAACTTGNKNLNAKNTKAHHTSNGFKNVTDYQGPGFSDFFKWKWDGFFIDRPSEEDYNFPLEKNDLQYLKNNKQDINVTWIGHATFLIQIKGLNMLTDPQFSKRASPLQWAGPKRVIQPGIAIKDLPPIDAVILSHDHYDSLDVDSIKKLRQRPGGEDTVFFTPLNYKDWFKDLGVSNVSELDWWETKDFKGVKIQALPVQHWCKRSLFDANKRLWAGWAILADDYRMFFGGDSGYTHHFKEIGEKLGPFDLALIPIGAYEPRWFMKFHHLNPDDAVKVHQNIQSKQSIGMHWGTFILTDEPLTEPPQKLSEALNKYGVNAKDFYVLKHGETKMLMNSQNPDPEKIK